MDIYEAAARKADEIEAELKRLARWSLNPLPAEAFEDMGAFGSNTMSFENWLQFVLIPRIREIVKEQGNFPAGSNLAPYAIRYFDGDYASDLYIPVRNLSGTDYNITAGTSLFSLVNGTGTPMKVKQVADDHLTMELRPTE